MIARRNIAGLLGAGAVAATAMTVAATGARADTAPQNVFDRALANKKIRAGAVASGAPWFMKDQVTGKWSGQFFIMATALASDMGVELELVETTWGNAVLDLQADKIDIMFGLNPTPKRAMVVDYSSPLYDSALVAIVRDGFTPTTWDAMNDPQVKIAVDVGSAHDQVATHLCPKASIIRFPSIDAATLALRSGRADAQCIFWMGGVRAVKKDPGIGKVIVPQPMFGSTSHATFRREPDRTWRDFVSIWITYSRGLGLIHDAVVTSLEQVGLSLNDIPPGVSL